MIEQLVSIFASQYPATTYIDRRSAARDFEKWLDRAAEPEDFNMQTVSAWLAEREGTCTADTLKKRRVSVCWLWRLGHEAGMIPEPPPPKRQTRKPQRHEAAPATDDEIKHLLARLKRFRQRIHGTRLSTRKFWTAWVLVAVDTGLRVQLQRQLHWYAATRNVGPTMEKFVTGFGPNPRVWISPEATEAILQIQRAHPSPLAFCGLYPKRGQLTHRFLEIARQCDLPQLNLTSLVMAGRARQLQGETK